MKKLTREQVIDRFVKIHNGFYTYEKFIYFDSNSKGIITCPIHGDFKQTAYIHYKGSICKKCVNEKLSKERSKGAEQCIKEFIKVHGDKYGYERVKYINARSKVEIYCKKCQKYFWQTPINHSVGKGCMKCRGKQSSLLYRKTQEQCILNFKKIHGDEYGYELVNYINNHTKVKIYCKKCKEYFNQTPSAHYCEQGCPKCSNYSKGENLIKLLLVNKKCNFSQQFRIDNCKGIRHSLPFDFAIFDKNNVLFCLVEYDGKQHFNKTSKFYSEDLIRNDAIKTNYCKENKIKLLRVSFLQFKNINTIIEKVLKEIK